MAIAAPENLTRNQCVSLAKLGEQSKRYKEMVCIMQRLVVLVSSSSSNAELTVEERNLLSVAYKNTIGPLRTAWQTLSSIEQQEEGRRQNEDRMALVKQYRHGVEKELLEVGGDVLGMLEKYLVPSASTSEVKVFYLKMKGDYHRYLAEIKAAGSHERKEAAEETLRAYKSAEDIAAADLSPAHPTRVALALNFCVFYHEILNAPEKACDMARQAFDDAVSELDKLQKGEDSYKDCTVIMQLLKDNFTLWTSNMHVEDNYYS